MESGHQLSTCVLVADGTNPSEVLCLLWALVQQGEVIRSLHVWQATPEADAAWRTRATGPRGGLSQLRAKVAGAIPKRAEVHRHTSEADALVAARSEDGPLLVFGAATHADERSVRLDVAPTAALNAPWFHFPGQEEQRIDLEGGPKYACEVNVKATIS